MKKLALLPIPVAVFAALAYYTFPSSKEEPKPEVAQAVVEEKKPDQMEIVMNQTEQILKNAPNDPDLMVFNMPTIMAAGLFQQMQESCPQKLQGKDAEDIEALMVAGLFIPSLGQQKADQIDVKKAMIPDEQTALMSQIALNSFNVASASLEESFKTKPAEEVCAGDKGFPQYALKYLEHVKANGTLAKAYEFLGSMKGVVKPKDPKEMKPALVTPGVLPALKESPLP